MNDIKRLSRDLTPIKAFQANQNQLSGHLKENSEMLETVISVLITQLSDSLHSTIRMNENQIAMCTADIISEFWYYKLEEIVWIINNARRKKTFNRLDQSVIFECFTDYEKDRQRIVEQDKSEKMRIDNSERDIEEKALKRYYEQSKNGEVMLFVSMMAKIEKQRKDEQDDYEKQRAKYYTEKEIKEIQKNKKIPAENEQTY